MESYNDPEDAAYVATGIDFPWTLLISPMFVMFHILCFPSFTSQKWSVDERVIPTAVTIFYEEFISK